MQIVTDPNGILVNGKRYPQGTPLSEVEGATSAHMTVWKRFKQIGEAGSEQSTKGKRKNEES
jgi:hypothetical protein